MEGFRSRTTKRDIEETTEMEAIRQMGTLCLRRKLKEPQRVPFLHPDVELD